MQQKLLTLFVVFCILLNAKDVYAKSAKCSQNKPLIIGVQNINYSPHYNFVTEEKSAYFNELIAWLAQKTNCQFKIKVLPIKRLQLSFANQQVDFMYPDNPNWHNEPDAKRFYSIPVTTALGGTMVKADKKSIDLTMFKTLAFPRGFTPVAWYQLNNKERLVFKEVSSPLAALKMVIANRADGADIEYNVASFLTEKYQLEPLVLAKDLPFTPTHFHISTYNQVDTLKVMNTLIATNPQLISKLKQKHNLAETTPLR